MIEIQYLSSDSTESIDLDRGHRMETDGSVMTQSERSSEIKILFGSETGTAEEFAFDIENSLQTGGYRCSVSDMEDYNSADLASEGLVLIVTSTYGNGEAPYNAEDLYMWLETEEVELNQTSFAVCALGDSGYPNFAQAGKDFDKFLGEKGAQRILPRTELDAVFDEPVEPFIEKLMGWLDENGKQYLL